ncbi:hypothetical protein Hanom_Chr02g00134001 [Helianthus anomalus]
MVVEWKIEFEDPPKRHTPVQFKIYLETQHARGRIFELNFLIFYNTILGETTHNSSINMRFFHRCIAGFNIRSFNWCEYMIKCLDRNLLAISF